MLLHVLSFKRHLSQHVSQHELEKTFLYLYVLSFFETVKGFAADEPVYKEGALAGVQLRDVGIAKNGSQKDTYEPGERVLRLVFQSMLRHRGGRNHHRQYCCLIVLNLKVFAGDLAAL